MQRREMDAHTTGLDAGTSLASFRRTTRQCAYATIDRAPGRLLVASRSLSGSATAGGGFAVHGISVAVPSGWWATGGRMSNVLQPAFRVTLSDRALRRTPRDSGPCYAGIARQIQPGGVVAILSEALGADFKPARFRPRPGHFVLPPRKPGEDNSCLGDHATLVTFRESGRGFYLWIAAGRRASPARVAALLRALDGMTARRRTRV